MTPDRASITPDVPAVLGGPDVELAPSAQLAAALITFDPARARTWLLTSEPGDIVTDDDLAPLVERYGEAGGFGTARPQFWADHYDGGTVAGGVVVVEVNPGAPRMLRLAGTWNDLPSWCTIAGHLDLTDASDVDALVAFLDRVAQDSIETIGRSFAALTTLGPIPSSEGCEQE